MTAMIECKTNVENDEFVADRISKSATIRLTGSIEEVFPLFGPVREMDWEAGWKPQIIFSNSRWVEEHMIFKSKGRFEGEDYYQWIVTQYFPDEHLIEYLVSAPDRIWFIRVQCEPDGLNTRATVTYTYTSLNSRGSHLNSIALDQMYSRDLKDWEEAINYYLKHGIALQGSK